jgi:hypothetical protein
MSRSFYRVYGEARQKDARFGRKPSRWNLSGYGLWLGLWAMETPLGGRRVGEKRSTVDSLKSKGKSSISIRSVVITLLLAHHIALTPVARSQPLFDWALPSSQIPILPYAELEADVFIYQPS